VNKFVIAKKSQPLGTQPTWPRHSFFSFFIRILLVVSLLGCTALLIYDLFPRLVPLVTHGPVSALPLLLIGLAYLGLQALLRPQPLELLKRIMLASAFILWGIDQLLPMGPIATTLGDVVIVLYIIDLALMMHANLKPTQTHP